MHFSPLFIAAFASYTLAAPVAVRDSVKESDSTHVASSYDHEHKFAKTTPGKASSSIVYKVPEPVYHDGTVISSNANSIVNDRRQWGGEFASGKQGASADAYGGISHQGQVNKPVVSGAGNSVTTGGAQQANNGAQGGQVGQSQTQAFHRRQFSKGGQQGSADGYGGASEAGEVNAPVLSGVGSSLTSGGPQTANDGASGGEIGQSLTQGFGQQQRRQFSQGGQQGSADAFGGQTHQGQINKPVVSGFGNSATTGGQQYGDDSAHGGSVGQTLGQGYGQQERRQYYGYYAPPQFASGKQGASADALGGESHQFQDNAPVISGYGNSVTAGGAQGADNSAKGGSDKQSLTQGNFYHRRDIGQGQANVQVASADAKAGPAIANGTANNVDSSAHGGKVVQVAGAKQDALNKESSKKINNTKVDNTKVDNTKVDDTKVDNTKNVQNNVNDNTQDNFYHDGEHSFEKRLIGNVPVLGYDGSANSEGFSKRLIGNVIVLGYDGSANSEGFSKRLIGNLPIASFDGSANQQGGFGKRLISNLPLVSYDGSDNKEGGFEKRLIGNLPLVSYDGSANKESFGKRLIGNLPVLGYDGSANRQGGFGKRQQFSSEQLADGDALGGDSSDFQTNAPFVEGNGLSKTTGGAQESTNSAQGSQISQSA